MEVNVNVNTAAIATEQLAGQLSGIRGSAGRSRGIATGDQGFGQIFLQMMNGAGKTDAAVEWLNQQGLPAGEEEAENQKESPWAMLMAALEVLPQNPDLRRTDLLDSSGEMTAVLNALEAVEASAGPEAVKTPVLNVIVPAADPLGNAAGRQNGEFLEEPVLAALIQEAAVDLGAAGKGQGKANQGPGAGQTTVNSSSKESFLTAGAGQEKEDQLAVLAGRGKGLAAAVIGYEDESGQGAAGERLFLGRQQFSQAVEEARSKLSAKAGGRGTEGINEASLSSETAFRTLMANPTAAEDNPLMPEELDIPQQIFTGLSKNLAAKKSEFVIKLMPEGLGEVTVRLLEKEGKTTLRIITASSETARLINNDLHVLRDALRPIQVEVHEAVPETRSDSEAGGYQQQFAQFGQFNQFSRQGNQSEYNGGAQRQAAIEEGWQEDFGQWTPAAPDSDLDLYV